MPGLIISDDQVSLAFREKVRNEIKQAEIRVCELLGIESLPKRKEIAVKFQCKFPGCKQEVSTNKGVGAYCTLVAPSTGNTHRQIHLIAQRKEDPDYMRKGRHLQAPGRRPAPSAAGEISARRITGENDHSSPGDANGSISWLAETRVSLNEAMQQVEHAEQELGQAKDRLRTILDEARTALGQA